MYEFNRKEDEAADRHLGQKLLTYSQGTRDRNKTAGVRFIIIVALISLALLAVWGIFSRIKDHRSLKTETAQGAVLVVNVTQPTMNATGSDIVLPGNVKAWHEASLQAQVSGYLKVWHKDIGDRVAAGDILAEIDTPETDQQLHQAEADLSLAIANNSLAQATAKRWAALLKTDSVTRQETDEKIADAKAKAASVQSQIANRDRLKQLQGFKNIVAPFDGVVTARTVDVGALVNTTGGELYHIATTDKLRIYVSVPENYTSALSTDTVAELHLTARPQETYQAKLSSTSGAIDPATRTLLAQFELDNPDGKLFPGGYAEVHLKTPQGQQTLSVPANALIFQGSGLQVATVGQDNKIQLKTVTPGRDFGKTLEIADGLNVNDRVVINPADSLYQGEDVKVAAPMKADGGAQQQQAKDSKKADPSNSGQGGVKESSVSKDENAQKANQGDNQDQNKSKVKPDEKQKNSKDPNTKDDSK